MFVHQENQHEKGAPRVEHGVDRSVARTHRAQIAAVTPSYSNTRKTNCVSNPLRALHAVGVGLEVWTADGTERGRIITNGNYSKLITSPVPLDAAPSKAAHIDWLSFTFRLPEGEQPMPLLRLQIPLLLGLLDFSATSKGGGSGYETMYKFTDGKDVQLGQIAFGGEYQRGTILVTLNGTGCALVQDWFAVQAWLDSLDATITRCDPAHDDLEGKNFTMEKVVDMYKRGDFINGGRMPSHKVHGDWFVEGSPCGRTFEVGKRTSGKMLRIYEKGKQLGDSISPWVRVELELHGKDRIIPLDILTMPGKFLAGSFNCLNFLSEVQEKIRTISKAATISYESSVKNLRLAGGKLLNLMMMVAGGDAFQVLSDLVRDGYPERLKSYAELLPQIYAGGAT